MFVTVKSCPRGGISNHNVTCIKNALHCYNNSCAGDFLHKFGFYHAWVTFTWKFSTYQNFFFLIVPHWLLISCVIGISICQLVRRSTRHDFFFRCFIFSIISVIFFHFWDERLAVMMVVVFLCTINPFNLQSLLKSCWCGRFC